MKPLVDRLKIMGRRLVYPPDTEDAFEAVDKEDLEAILEEGGEWLKRSDEQVLRREYPLFPFRVHHSLTTINYHFYKKTL